MTTSLFVGIGRRHFSGAFAAVILACASGAQAQGNDTSPFIDGIGVSSRWENVTANEGNHLRVDHQTVAYSGGASGNGRTVVFGGGHNNGLSDAVAYLDWRNFETVGWIEELPSTADHIGVGDFDFSEIGQYLNQNYNPQTPGGILDSRGSVALSRHTYDQLAVLGDSLYMFSGVLSFDNSGQPSTRWAEREGDIWRYDFGSGWTFVDAPLPRGYVTGHAAAAVDTLTGKIWVHEENGLRLFDPATGTVGSIITYLDSQAIESFMNFNPEKGAEGTLFGAGTYAGSNWHEYDIATGQERNMGRVPGNARNTYIIYVDSTYGPDYGTYFAFVPQDGTLRRWNGNGWDTIATGAPSNNDYVFGRAGFEEVHQVFYWIHNPYTSNTAWQTRVVRPYPFNGSAEPRPAVTLTADPESVAPQGMSTLNWSTTNADSCNASGAWSGSKTTSGQQSVGPLSDDRTYTLTCSGEGGTDTDTVTVRVVQNTPPPTVSLSANPGQVSAGSSTVLSWTSTDATACTAGGDWSGSKQTQGSESIGPLIADAQFTLNCSGDGGNDTGSVTVSVVQGTPAPTVSLSADPAQVSAGSSTELSWSSTNATGCTAGGDWSGNKSTEGSESIGPLNADAQFTLTCSGAGGSDSGSVTVRVVQGTPAPTVSLTADTARLNAGGSTMLRWTSTNATSCTAGGDWSGNKATQGSESTGTLNADAQFTLNCSGGGGEAGTTVSVAVNAPLPPPPGGGNDETVSAEAAGGAIGLPAGLVLLLLMLRRRIFSDS